MMSSVLRYQAALLSPPALSEPAVLDPTPRKKTAGLCSKPNVQPCAAYLSLLSAHRTGDSAFDTSGQEDRNGSLLNYAFGQRNTVLLVRRPYMIAARPAVRRLAYAKIAGTRLLAWQKSRTLTSHAVGRYDLRHPQIRRPTDALRRDRDRDRDLASEPIGSQA